MCSHLHYDAAVFSFKADADCADEYSFIRLFYINVCCLSLLEYVVRLFFQILIDFSLFNHFYIICLFKSELKEPLDASFFFIMSIAVSLPFFFFSLSNARLLVFTALGSTSELKILALVSVPRWNISDSVRKCALPDIKPKNEREGKAFEVSFSFFFFFHSYKQLNQTPAIKSGDFKGDEILCS